MAKKSGCCRNRARWFREPKTVILFVALLFAFRLSFPPPTNAQPPTEEDKSGQVDDYNQWKQALGSGRATDPRTIAAPPRFVVELLRSSRVDEGSWIALTFDPRGRILVSREDRGILRMTVRTSPAPAKDGEPAPEGEVDVESIDANLLECRGLLWAHDSLYANANNSKGLYRLRYDPASDRFSTPQLLRETPGGVGHGRNDLALGPDGMIYSIHGDDVGLPADFRPESSPFRNYADDRLLPCDWDQQLFNGSMKLPGGHLIRTDADGKAWELVAGGLRNPYGLDFNADGELFTYDADMEWDVGMPWYRPTRVLHLVSGADFGWRRGTGTWRAWNPESLPAAADIGLGSPTAVKFGTKSHFPAPYRDALFILDWAYGRILATHLTPTGGTYAGKFEAFISGRPLNVTDLEFGPDGAMYFLTGGRKTQSGLYRVRFASTGESAPVSPPAASAHTDTAARESRQRRRDLERLHLTADSTKIDSIWEGLGHADPWIRHAARVALERQASGAWRERALAEATPQTAVEVLLALSRVGIASDRDVMLRRLLEIPWNVVNPTQKLTWLRALHNLLAKHGRPEGPLAEKLVTSLSSHYPDASSEVNQVLCELLVFLGDPTVVSKTEPLLISAKTQEEKFHYLVTLRQVSTPWRSAERRQYLEWVRQAKDFYGAQYLPRYLGWLKADITAKLTPAEVNEFGALLRDEPAPATAPFNLVDRPHVRNWKLDDLAGSLSQLGVGRDFRRGREIFQAALCLRCHRMGNEGSPVGPDLTQVSRRFGRVDLLLSILAPSHVIDEKYRAVTVVTHSGKVVVGQLLGNLDADRVAGKVSVTTNLLFPDMVTVIPAADVDSLTPSLVSPMPAGLLNTFTRDEILDLLAYVESGGVPRTP